MFTNNRSCSVWNARYAGQEAFTANMHGYKHGRVLSINMRAHRVAWAIVHGQWPSEHIDHINGDRADNRLHNLRHVSRTVNNKNAKRREDNMSGCTGVHLDKRNSKWVAQINANGKRKFLGYFGSFAEARNARLIAEAQHGYHPNHGR